MWHNPTSINQFSNTWCNLLAFFSPCRSALRYAFVKTVEVTGLQHSNIGISRSHKLTAYVKPGFFSFKNISQGGAWGRKKIKKIHKNVFNKCFQNYFYLQKQKTPLHRRGPPTQTISGISSYYLSFRASVGRIFRKVFRKVLLSDFTSVSINVKRRATWKWQ